MAGFIDGQYNVASTEAFHHLAITVPNRTDSTLRAETYLPKRSHVHRIIGTKRQRSKSGLEGDIGGGRWSIGITNVGDEHDVIVDSEDRRMDVAREPVRRVGLQCRLNRNRLRILEVLWVWLVGGAVYLCKRESIKEGEALDVDVVICLGWRGVA